MILGSSTLLVTSTAVEIDRFTVNMWVRIGAAVLIVIATVIGAALLNRVARKIKKVGAGLGWVYRRKGTPLAVQEFRGFPLGGLASGAVDHEISGVWRGRPGKVFVLHESPPAYSAKFQVTMLALARPMPVIELHPRSNLQRNFDLAQEVLTGFDEFDKRWRVICQDPRYVRSIMTPGLMQRLLTDPSAQIPVTIDGSAIYSWSPVHRAPGGDVPATLGLLADVAEMLPLGLGGFGGFGEVASVPSPGPAAPLPDAQIVARPQPSKNSLALLSVLASVTCFLAPLGVILGHASLRANRRGEANNHRWAIIGLVFSYAITGVLALWMLAAALVTLVAPR